MSELVVLAGPDGTPCGTAPKEQVHTTDTPLHFAFSCWVIRGGEVLLTRRALSKQTWPGVWTNSFCGHPAPGEDPASAVVRRGAYELGVDPQLLQPRLVVPDFSYRAVDSCGIVEHEICPVFVCELPASTSDAQLRPHPEEVDSWYWAPAADVVNAVRALPRSFSPWMVEELAQPGLLAYLQALD